MPIDNVANEKKTVVTKVQEIYAVAVSNFPGTSVVIQIITYSLYICTKTNSSMPYYKFVIYNNRYYVQYASIFQPIPQTNLNVKKLIFNRETVCLHTNSLWVGFKLNI